MKTIGRAAALAPAVAILVASASAAAPSKLAVKGDPQAWAQISAAFVKMSKVKSYRAKIANFGAGGVPGTMEVVNPNRYHVVMTGQFESVQIGTETRYRTGNGPWQCTRQPAPPPVTDPSGMSGEVEAARGPAVAIDGVQTQSYTYTWKPGGDTAGAPVPNLTIRTRVFIAVASGLPKRAQTLDNNDKVETQMDYFDYDAPITIILPNCQ